MTPPAPTATTATPTPPTTTRAKFCVYSAQVVDELDDFAKRMGAPVDCALVFGSATNWKMWSTPWFINQRLYTYDWVGWKKAVPGRQLVVTQQLIPDTAPSDWLVRGAAGEYMPYAVQLAQNLVKAGLGDIVVRIGQEANGYWMKDSVPDDPIGQAQWRQFWANTVTAMRSVPGANFTFDWSVNYQWVRPKVSLSSFYPGDQYVDVIGLDAYDENLTQQNGRYAMLATRPGGINSVVSFATQHNKPISLPEWGLVAVNSPMTGGGDDPSYIDGIANLIKTNRVLYSSYWYAHPDTMTLLQNSPNSLARMQLHFGLNGDAR